MLTQVVGLSLRIGFDRCLKVSSEVVNESPASELPVTLKFTITNTALFNLGDVEVSFDEIHLRVGVSPNWHTEIITKLKGGQSYSFEFKCKYADLLEIKYDIESIVSSIAIIKAKRNVTQIHPYTSAISLVAFLRILNDIKIHRWLQEIQKNMTFIGPDTTIADVNRQVEIIKRTITEIEKNKKLLNDFLQFIPTTEKDDQFNRFMVQVEDYLNNTIKEFAELLRLYIMKEFDQLPVVRQHSVKRLANYALEENIITEEFLRQRNISDQDAHYSYRGWQIQLSAA